MSEKKTERLTAIRGSALCFTGNPFVASGEDAVEYLLDAIIVLAKGKIREFGAANDMLPKLPADISITSYPNALILPGFIDCHVHYAQTQVIGAGGESLMNWLDKYTFPAEKAFADPSYAQKAANIYVDETLRNGTTTAAVFCTVHPVSVDALFEVAHSKSMRMLAGKVLMDRNAPKYLTDSPQQGYDESKYLIDRWHEMDRLHYCISPRFAPSCSPEQLEAAGALWREHPTTYVQSHVSETTDEIAWVKQLFPERSNYLDVYDHFGLMGKRCILGHALHLTGAEWRRVAETGTSIAHCPTSNLFLGSGHFDISNAKRDGKFVRVGLGTDLGAGTSFSHLQTMGAAYQVARMQGCNLTAIQAFYLATTGAAETLYLGDKIGNLASGLDADLVVLDLKSTPIIESRMQFTETLEEMLFVQMTMADDRAVQATYVAGEIAYARG